MFWKVPGFSQILDKDEYTLEELLDEDDIIQECKSLNGRLVAFLRERSSVEQLIRYLVEPQDSDDPKRTYKYPFTSCEVLCCDLEAVYNTLLEDSTLMQLLFSLLEQPAPLNCKTAGYFGRVVSNLLLRKGPQMLEYMQHEGTTLISKLVKHVDTTSIADILKRMVGGDENTLLETSTPSMSPWLAGTLLLDLLLERLDARNSPEAQANAAAILSATAHTQPSPLAAKLAQPEAVAALVGHALAPGRQVLVPALDVCIALLEPRTGAPGDALGSLSESTSNDAVEAAKRDAVAALVPHVPRLVELLGLEPSSDATQDTPYGRLAPPLGRHRLKAVELLAALVHSGVPAAEQAVIQSSALQQCMRLFAAFPFNNLLHHSVSAMLQTCMGSDTMSIHLVEECGVVDWILSLPTTVMPVPVPGDEGHTSTKAPLRSGYLGHVTQIAGKLAAAGTTGRPGEEASSIWGGGGGEAAAQLSGYLRQHERWCQYVEDVLKPQQELEDTSSWVCGRPPKPPVVRLDSEGDDFGNEMDLDQLTGLHQPLFHRYGGNDVEEEDLEEEEEEDGLGEGGPTRTAGETWEAGLLADALSRMELEQRGLGEEGEGGYGEVAGKSFWMTYNAGDGYGDGTPVSFHTPSSAQAPSHNSMDDDDVLLGADDDESGSPERRGSALGPVASPGPSPGGPGSGEAKEDGGAGPVGEGLAAGQGSPQAAPGQAGVTATLEQQSVATG